MARRVACFDIDGTLHRGTRLGYSLGECVARACVERGLAPADSFSHTEELLASYDRRQISFDSYVSAFTKKLEDGFFGGMKETEVCALAAEIAAQERERTYVFTRELLRACQSLGYCTIAISGSFYGVVEPFARAWGFEHVYGTELHTDDDGMYHGTQERTIVHARKKGELLHALAVTYELDLELGSIAVGDALSDASMLEQVEFPIMFNPTEELYDRMIGKSYLVVERRQIYASLSLPHDLNAAFRRRLDKTGFKLRNL